MIKNAYRRHLVLEKKKENAEFHSIKLQIKL